MRQALLDLAFQHGVSAELPEEGDPLLQEAMKRLLLRIEDQWCHHGHATHTLLYRARPPEEREMISVAVIGDVHGDVELLMYMVRQIEAKATGRLILCSVGDVIDRGPKSREVIDFLIAKGVQCVTGNHELWLHQLACTGEFDDFALKPFMGGAATLESYGFERPWTEENLRAQRNRFPDSHRAFLREQRLLRIYEIGVGRYARTLLLSHAGISQEAIYKLRSDLKRSDLSDLDLMEIALRVEPRWGTQILWSAVPLQKQAILKKTYSVSGHLPRQYPAMIGSIELQGAALALDTGSATAYDRKLSAVVFLSSPSEEPNRAFFLSVSRSPEGVVVDQSQTVEMP